MTLTVDDGQSLVDIALQQYGGVEGIFELLQDNDIGLTDSLEAGTTLQVLATYKVDVQVGNYYDRQKRKIATDYALPTGPQTLEYSELDYNAEDYK